ncbi:MAG: tetratricopeptide repeat protein [Campylobacterales bacterium]|nr:tetratricopeptide repeat protein [Campylobacterales bacterium]
MADANEEIIIIEESEVTDFQSTPKEEEIATKESPLKNKKLLIFGGAGALLLLIIIIALFLIFKSFKEEKAPPSTTTIEKKEVIKVQEPIEASKLENMIAKANYLYSNGNKEEALSLYERIALFSEAISQYNLGVAQLINKQYDMALKTFQKAIQNDEKRCVSAINAAVCSMHLGDKESFRYYIDLAYAYLPNEIDSPLYSYYYTLINYYNGNYLEALSALKNPTSDEYPEVQKHLSAKIDSLFENNNDAIETIKKEFDKKDSLSLGLSYARVGDTVSARKYLYNAIQNNIEPAKAQLALGLVNIKAGLVAKGAMDIKTVTDSFPDEAYNLYPIKVVLKDSLFEPKKAQQLFKNKLENSRSLNYQKIFYFSPYKVFNADKTINYIRKGNANMYIDNIVSATEYLEKSASSSAVNYGIAKAIKKALTFRIREANEELDELVKLQPKHSILHYNLALTYAQMGNMHDAHEHFLRSYYLDAKNYLSGIFAIMTGQLINKEHTKLTSIIKEAMQQEEHDENIDLYKTLLNISENDLLSSVDWLDNNYKQRPLYLALDIIISQGLNKQDTAKASSEKLTALLPNDILPHMMYIDAHFGDLKIIDYAKEVQNYLKIQKFDFNDLYYGPEIVRYLYIQQNLITGKLFFLREQLKHVLDATTENPYEIISALALASLYDKAYEESFTLYNQLIDELKIRDADTLFLGAVASIAAKHNENAVALLELSKLQDTDFLESRYALGLLYLELQNHDGAVIQLLKIGDNGFSSEFFNFEIDSNKLLYEFQKKENSANRKQKEI